MSIPESIRGKQIYEMFECIVWFYLYEDAKYRALINESKMFSAETEENRYYLQPMDIKLDQCNLFT